MATNQCRGRTFYAVSEENTTSCLHRKVEWRRAVYEFLSRYRHTPNCTTKISPSEMMFNRKVRHTIPDQLHQSRENINEKLERNDEESKQKAKQYMDKRSHAKE